VKRTFKFRIFPTKKQTNLLNQTLKECCWLYNHFLEERKISWEEKGKSVNYYSQTTSLPKLKKEILSLANIHSQVLQNVATRIDLAFKAFFRRVKEGQKPGYPRFKGKGWYDSFTYPQAGYKITHNGLELSKIGTIKIKQHRPIKGIIKNCTIKRTLTGKWYAYFVFETETNPLTHSNEAIGIDVGINSFATFSNKKKIVNPHFFKTEEKALAKAQRKMSKQKKNTPERRKAKKVVSRVHERIANRRHNFAHQESKKIVDLFGIVCVEDLNIQRMRNGNYRSLNKSIGDVAWGQFTNFLAYKAENAGRQIILVNPAYTSQTCSECGHRKAKKLSCRIHSCSMCGFKTSRDHNASLNILSLGLQTLSLSQEASAFRREE